MKLIKKIRNKLKYFIGDKDIQKPFFTKDIFSEKKFLIGDYTYGKPIVLFENEESNLTIGKFCSIAANVTIFLGGNHRIDWITTYPFNVLNTDFPEAAKIKGHPSSKGGVSIGHDVWIGRNVTILSGITIGSGAVIAANTVVTKDIGNYEIWGGNPGKLIKKRFDEEEIDKLMSIEWWDWEIKKIRNEVHYLCSNKV